MESVEVENAADVNRSESDERKVEESKHDSLTDIASLDIKSRLTLKATEIYEELHANGISRVNGIYDSPERIASTANLPQSKTMETSHLSQHGMGNSC